jgi:peptidoglycan hydrolase-like protein with peptidoglycan-binding domain
MSLEDLKTLQSILSRRGHDVGKIDGVVGAKTRAAVKVEQRRTGLPEDAYPTPELLARLRGS